MVKVGVRMVASIAQCNVILRTLFSLVPLTALAFSRDFCSRGDYGQPSYEACASLLYGKAPAKKGIFNLDAFDHAFYLPYFAKPSDFTPTQWRHRVIIPEIWSTSKRLARQRLLPRRSALSL